MNKLTTKEIAQMLLQLYPNDVMEYLPKHYIINEFWPDRRENAIKKDVLGEIEGWVKECMTMHRYTNLQVLANDIKSRMLETYYLN